MRRIEAAHGLLDRSAVARGVRVHRGVQHRPPFLLVGLAMLVLGPLRPWPRLFWPPLVGVLAFILGVILFVPLYCTATAEVGQVSHTACTSLLGLSWSGTGIYNPPPEAYDTAFRVGIAAALGAAIATLVALTLRRHRGLPPA